MEACINAAVKSMTSQVDDGNLLAPHVTRRAIIVTPLSLSRRRNCAQLIHFCFVEANQDQCCYWCEDGMRRFRRSVLFLVDIFDFESGSLGRCDRVVWTCQQSASLPENYLFFFPFLKFLFSAGCSGCLLWNCAGHRAK